MKKGHFCPLIKKDCIENKCVWFTQIRGINPNTGEPIDEWQCAVNFLPFLIIENAQRQLSTASAIESFRNETVKQNDTLNELIVHSINQQIRFSSVQEAEVRLLSETNE